MQYVMALVGALLASKVIIKIITAFGLGIITFTALVASFNSVRDMVISNYASLPAATIQLLSLASVDTALGLVLGALVVKVSYLGLSKIGSVVGAS